LTENEKQKTGKPGRPKDVEILGATKSKEGKPEILGSAGSKVGGPLKTLDSRHGEEGQKEIDAYVHASRKGFKEEVDKP
jgi:hypothetical protein